MVCVHVSAVVRRDLAETGLVIFSQAAICSQDSLPVSEAPSDVLELSQLTATSLLLCPHAASAFPGLGHTPAMSEPAWWTPVPAVSFPVTCPSPTQRFSSSGCGSARPEEFHFFFSHLLIHFHSISFSLHLFSPGFMLQSKICIYICAFLCWTLFGMYTPLRVLFAGFVRTTYLRAWHTGASKTLV